MNGPLEMLDPRDGMDTWGTDEACRYVVAREAMRDESRKKRDEALADFQRSAKPSRTDLALDAVMLLAVIAVIALAAYPGVLR